VTSRLGASIALAALTARCGTDGVCAFVGE
jgi:hypothetical protein